MDAATSSSESVDTLFHQLVQCLIKTKTKQSHVAHETKDSDAEHKYLKRRAYEILFKHLNGPLSKKFTLDSDEQKATIQTKEGLLQVVFQLRMKRKFDEAHRLEKLIGQLPDVEQAQHSDLKSVIEVLLKFTGSQSPNASLRGLDLPLTKSKHDIVALPKGPLYHGDSKYLYQQQDGYEGYIHFSRDLFEGLHGYYSSQLDSAYRFNSVQPYVVNYQVMNAEPGKGIPGSGLFGDMPIIGNAHEKDNRETLFHGLTNSRTSNLNIKLTVPALPNTTNPELLGLKVPAVRSEMSEDEGFHEVSSTASVADTPTDGTDAFWDAVLHYKPNKHFTWETIGRHPRTTERPYLSEAGPEALDALYKVLCHQASMLGKTPLRPQIKALDQKALVRDALHVLIAVPSVLFQLDQEHQCLVVNRDVCLKGLTPQSFHHLLEDFAAIGTDYLYLSHFAKQRTLDSSYSGGLVLQAFTTGVRRFLQYYQALVQLVPAEKLTLLTIKDKFGELTSQLRYLADLCMSSQRGRGRGSQPGDPGDLFPTGIKLLSYLYQEALDCRNLQKYRLVLSLLRTSCGPYLMHVQDWIFHGVCHDVYGEFMITVNDNYLHHRDKYYWTEGYVLTTPTIEDNVPIFLQDMAYDIYVCGKSINLLKLCCPEHFVCNPDVDVPRVSLTYSPEELQKTVERSRGYLNHMRFQAKMQTISRAEKEQQDEEAKHALLAEARRSAALELKRIEDIIRGEKEKADKKKREIFKELKEQMQKDLVRRALAVEEELQEDKDRIEAIKRQEQTEAETESELERQAKEEIIEYYAKLSEEAAKREQRALWRIQRHRLDERRIEWIMQEEEAIRQALNLRSRTGILPSGEQRRKVTKEQQDTVESSAQTDLVPVSDNPEGIPDIPNRDTKDMGTNEMNVAEETDVNGDDLSGADKGVTAIPSSDVGVLISLEDSRLETGDVGNEDIEATLNLIQGSTTSKAAQNLPLDQRTVTPLNLLDNSISDFFPYEVKDDDEERAMIDPEADVGEVLLEIGSELPLKKQSDESVQPSQSAHGHASDSNFVIGQEIGSNKGHTQPVKSVHGHTSDSNFTVGQEIGQDLPEGQIASKASIHGHTSDSHFSSGLVAPETTDKVSGMELRSKDGDSKRKTWVKQVGASAVAGHPSDSHGVLDDVTDGEQRKPNLNVNGHTSDSHFTVGQEIGAVGEIGPPNQNVHGHPSQSHFSGGQSIETEDVEVKERNIQGHAADSNFVVGQEIGDKAESVQPSQSAHGHASDSNFVVGQEIGSNKGHTQPVKSVHGHTSDSNFAVGQEIGQDLPEGQIASKASIHGHTSDSQFSSGLGTPETTDKVSGMESRSKDDDGKRKTWVKQGGASAVAGHPSVSHGVLDDVTDGEQIKLNVNVHGHTSDSHFTVGQEIGAVGEIGPPNQNVHGHPSQSHFSVGQSIETEEVEVKERNIHGHAADSNFVVGQEIGDKAEFVQPSQSAHGHASDSNFVVGQEMGSNKGHTQPVKSVHGHTSDSNFTVGQEMGQDLPKGQITSKSSIHGHASDSHFSSGLGAPETTDKVGPASNKASIYGHASDATAGQLLYQSGDEDQKVTIKPISVHGHASDSTAGGLLYPISEEDDSKQAQKSGTSGKQIASSEHQTAVDGRSIHGHSSDSTIQGLMYPQPEEGLPVPGAKRKQVSHPSDSTAQKLLYGRAVLGGMATGTVQFPETVAEEEKEAEPVFWAGEGVEPLPDVFDMFNNFPNTDLLAGVGYVPLSVEIGEYGVQASDNETLEADEKMSLPIIMKRSVTTPLLAQIGLVNQSILDFYLVELGIDKHFKALRSFLFLEDGEFGQSLCEQLFDKLAQGLRPKELLSPIILNQVLPRAIQSSANRESDFAELLGFTLKWLPPFFKPNAIDTFDCLELRYRVDWPFNIVITETCLIKYNKVFSFLLQLKRTSWVLRDIYFQLKRSANVNHAGNSPQFRQLQLFRHEMQHFVSVMQGYVVNQVIHVSWEEFQRELKTSVHNLDDLHQKHAEYLNKAVFRCLLNKKAATLMKIITDILCLILKVRTQLISSSWIYDQASHAVVHPAFPTIKSSYLAFKDYSGFLYKVVAKLVTRGYQPHLEEFLLRLNFNDFYKES